ncbi:hypothetical protein AMAG_15431 [Allomyces macrogynus ATCC 38327]|uniref:Uncharacterized protein n=1 Tax=Allomyces macrogynus (strain ATCC 38327) TaxID=578462 RepID=A0A0L0T7Y9_ALLM3|nr:hypothetical protein AMAG_15431 [Allomyces macrogynus ATCC 38327]|eukprot:KNE70674.1 hypothetical protein AMAG_15431 [Allomyces macrogynus ATCC 38327]
MAECYKILQDLEAARARLDTQFLAHLFRDFSPTTSPHVRQALLAVAGQYASAGDARRGGGIRAHYPHATVDAATLDLRPAYHQFADWLFGWSVGESAARAGTADSANDSGNSATGTDRLAVHRVPRDMDLAEPAERLECMRILETFQTQYSLGVRYLRRAAVAIEERMPLIGKNIAQVALAEEAATDRDDERAVWGNVAPSATDAAAGRAGAKGDDGKPAPPHASAQPAPQDTSRPLPAAAASEPTNLTMIDDTSSDLQELLRNVEETLQANGADTPTALPISRPPTHRRASLKPVIPPPSRRGSIKAGAPAPGIPPHQPLPTKPPGRRGSINAGKLPGQPGPLGGMSRRGSLAGAGGSRSGAAGNASTMAAAGAAAVAAADGDQAAKPNTPKSPPDSKPASAAGHRHGSGSGSRSASATGKRTKPSAAPLQLSDDEIRKQDLDMLFMHVSESVDLHLACVVSCLVVITLAELTENKPLYIKFTAHVYETCTSLVATALRTLGELIRRSLPNEPVAAAQLRDLHEFAALMQQVLKSRTYSSSDRHYLILSRFTAKLAVLHALFAGCDVFLFPPFVPAHRDGVKSVCQTSFDSNLWLTGGYDCKVRIWDVADKQCLAQLAGHKSIVTDVRFVKSDAYIVSASFDKTIKIWNAQTATCERTLTGHADSITTCDVSPDGRYIVSGSLDMTLRLWDWASGECLSVVKKHARYIKAVKFSVDGRYVASAGLDRRVYLWDVKILAYSKNVSHVRCIEAHDDAILAMDMQRPNVLVTVSRDQSVKLWDYMTGHCIYGISLSPAWACTVAFGFDGELFAVGCFDNSVHVFRTKTGERVRLIKVLNMGVLTVKFPSQHYDFILCGSSEGFVQKIPL